MNGTLPYIPDQVGIPILCQPYRFLDADMATFLLDSQAASLNNLLDTYINAPSNGQYQYRCVGAGSSGTALSIMIMAQMTVNAKNTNGQEYGKERYSELSFWIPCYDELALKRGQFRLGLFLPFLFPDSFSAIATGREMFGFRKQLANFTYPLGKLDLKWPQFAAHTTAYKTLAADTVAQSYPFISLSSGDKGLKEILEDALWSEAESVGAGLIEHWLGEHWINPVTGEKLGAITNDFLKDCPAIFLKQFPKISDATQAQSRAIAEAPFSLQKVHSAFPYLDLLSLKPKTFDLTVEKLASHPIVAQLGLSPSSSTPDADVVPVKGFAISVDFGLELGQVLQDVKPPKKKIAVLGGGIGSLAAVYGITQVPGWQDQYDITLYQMGWRLGGKGASGRNPQIGDRIEEHGLHIWFGYYENAFSVIRQCYAEMNRSANAPMASWDQAFRKHNTIVVQEYVNNHWTPWTLSFPPNDESPGDGKALNDHPLGIFSHLREALTSLHNILKEHTAKSGQASALLTGGLISAANEARKKRQGESDGLLGRFGHALEQVVEKVVVGVVEYEVEKSIKEELTSIDEFFTWFETMYQNFPEGEADLKTMQQGVVPKETTEHWQNIITELFALVQQTLQPFAEVFDSIRRIITLVELALAVGRGILMDGVLWYGYSAIDQYDFTEWLIKNGASEAAANSGLVRAFYDLYLGFPDGKNTIVGDGVAIGGNTAAGELLHSYILVVLCYKGAIMWKMQAGMGDTVMTPLYQVLKQRGVKFEFFHQVSNLGLNAANQIDTIDINVQATLRPNVSEYNPQYNVKDLPCWPSEPLYDQLEQGIELRNRQINLESSWTDWQPVATKQLKLGQDFDQVILGISVAALPYITPQLMAASPAWKTMLEKASTTQTQAMQLWLNINLEETGWAGASPVLDAYGEPFNTWAVMDQTLDKENWPQNQLPISIAYFCNNMKQPDPIPPFSDHGYPDRATAGVKADALKWLQHYTGGLWPYATQKGNPSALNWDFLVDIENRSGLNRLDGQYFRANVDPTERYVCNAKNTNQYRLKAGASGFSNLFITGDWIDNGSLNLGCVESTVIAGLQAARALTGYPLTIYRETIFGNIATK
jgi:uncharacterized protein with NAD-binding domain and iron-sulfur cluster